ncbi:MAG: hypothetical protein ABI120_14965, partial [Gemmatimonadaceae bacterium]
SVALAQRGGGAGGGSSRGGGRGNGRGAGGFGSAESPIDRVKQQLKDADQLEFLDKKMKQLALTKEAAMLRLTEIRMSWVTVRTRCRTRSRNTDRIHCW